MEHVLKDKEEGELRELRHQRRERHLPRRHPNALRHGVEEPNLCHDEQCCSRNREKAELTAGSSIVKWENRTCLVHSHCSFAVGTFAGWSFHLRK